MNTRLIGALCASAIMLGSQGTYHGGGGCDCGGESPLVLEGECYLGSTQRVPCGFNNEGTLERICTQSEDGSAAVWKENSACSRGNHKTISEFGVCSSISGTSLAFISMDQKKVYVCEDVLQQEPQCTVIASAEPGLSYTSFDSVHLHNTSVAFTAYKVPVGTWMPSNDGLSQHREGIVDGILVYNISDGSLTRLPPPEGITFSGAGVQAINDGYLLIEVAVAQEDPQLLPKAHLVVYNRASMTYQNIVPEENLFSAHGSLYNYRVAYVEGIREGTNLFEYDLMEDTLEGTTLAVDGHPETVSLSETLIAIDSWNNNRGYVSLYNLETKYNSNRETNSLKNITPNNDSEADPATVSAAFHPSIGEAYVLFKYRTTDNPASVANSVPLSQYGYKIFGYNIATEQMIMLAQGGGREWRDTEDPLFLERRVPCKPSQSGSLATFIGTGHFDGPEVIVYDMSTLR